MSLLSVLCPVLTLKTAGLAPGQFVFMLNNGPETDTAIYDGTNNGLGLTPHTAQVCVPGNSALLAARGRRSTLLTRAAV